MKITSAEFIISAPDFKSLPKADLPEIVLIGKSNVGKSSFINAFARRKAIARISSSPGKTRMANFYLINESFYIVDMPGYGYAKASKSMKKSFDNIITDYLAKREADFVVLFLIDSRHTPTDNDISMYEKILSYDIFPAIILTKWDKLNMKERNKSEETIRKTLNLDEDDMLIATSSETKYGFEKVYEFIDEIL